MGGNSTMDQRKKSLDYTRRLDMSPSSPNFRAKQNMPELNQVKSVDSVSYRRDSQGGKLQNNNSDYKQ